MDFNNVVKAVFPKSQQKALKKRFKKDGIKGILLALLKPLVSIFFHPTYNRQFIAESRPNTFTQKKRNDPLLEELAQAHTYRQNILMMAENSEIDSLERIQLAQLNERITDWVEKLESFVTRIVAQRKDSQLEAQRKRATKAIKRLETQIQNTNGPELKQKLNVTLQNRRNQLAHLNHLATQREMALLKVENTVAQLSIIYSQLQSGQYLKKQSRFERLTVEISDEVEGLNDYLITLNDLQTEQAKPLLQFT